MGWRTAGALELEELDVFLLARAMEHDSPTRLFRLGCEYLISARSKSTSTPNSPRSARRATGRCGCVTPCSDRPRRYPRARFVCSRPSHSVVVISGIRSAQDRSSWVQSWSQARG
nr:hypothetical protein [Nocardia carnea]